MRKVEQFDYSYGDDEYLSIFIGQCASQEKLDDYLDKDYDLLINDYIGWEMGIDFGINTYDEDFMVAAFYDEATTEVEKILQEADPDVISKIKESYSDHFPEAYNAFILLDRIKFEGDIKEVYNPDFGVFKFIGYFPST